MTKNCGTWGGKKSIGQIDDLVFDLDSYLTTERILNVFIIWRFLRIFKKLLGAFGDKLGKTKPIAKCPWTCENQRERCKTFRRSIDSRLLQRENDINPVANFSVSVIARHFDRFHQAEIYKLAVAVCNINSVFQEMV